TSGGNIPPELSAWAERFDLADFLHERTLANQFQAITASDPTPSLFVVNLFHENEPLFAHRSGYLFFVDPASWNASPEFEAWMKAEFQQVKLPVMDYLNRWAQFVSALRQGYPSTPILLASQLSHYPAFGPHPYSYLTCWEKAWREAGGFLRAVAAELGNCRLLDADRIFSGVWNSQVTDIDDHCPFLKVTIDGDGSGPWPDLRRDMEHIGTLWPAMARKVKGFLRTGQLTWDNSEQVPASWEQPYSPKPLSRERLRILLATGGNYDGARAVNAFLHDMDHDHTDLLAENAEAMPVCHGTLHMVHRYAMLKPNRALLTWCESQKEKIALFTTNGTEFQRRYTARLDEIVASVLMHSVANTMTLNPSLAARPPVC
ncbi:MAG: SGNH/GDSL hydrolase family protein, partial [Proteobacteria bacterium]|nr:SGNH/GDSL hydrolase family protein [Pseudomonadota bacterium]